ncbi:MAG: MogA/MoaB family molybdenum cofactor biosynthesis protein [Acidimicrobiia bacterium]|nr:MogA/MoaB family molybdenum cofactor biosynthesis protein [Acidimicrobiia bacterium]
MSWRPPLARLPRSAFVPTCRRMATGSPTARTVERALTEDGVDPVAATLRRLADGFHGLIVTTGGTGFGPRDRTPEGTKATLDREAPGLAEAMRLINPLGRLSRGVAGTLGTSLIVNTPGSSKGCVETIGAVIDVLPHAVTLLVDNDDPHPSGEGHGHGSGHG